MLILYLDAYHLGDPLFQTQLARDLAHRGRGAVLVHGGGEAAERALEAAGELPQREGLVWRAESAVSRSVVERATRELNRQIVHELNEAGVAAIRVLAADRGLLKQTSDGVRAGQVAWLADLVRQGVVAVVAALLTGADGALVEADPGAVCVALGQALPEAVVVVFEQQESGATDPSDGERVAGSVRASGARAQAIPRGNLRRIDEILTA